MCMQAAAREMKRAAAEVQEYKAHIKGLENDVEEANGRALSLDQELRRQQAALRELDAFKAELDATALQCSEWQSKHSYGSVF